MKNIKKTTIKKIPAIAKKCVNGYSKPRKATGQAQNNTWKLEIESHLWIQL